MPRSISIKKEKLLKQSTISYIFSSGMPAERVLGVSKVVSEAICSCRSIDLLLKYISCYYYPKRWCCGGYGGFNTLIMIVRVRKRIRYIVTSRDISQKSLGNSE